MRGILESSGFFCLFVFSSWGSCAPLSAAHSVGSLAPLSIALRAESCLLIRRNPQIEFASKRRSVLENLQISLLLPRAITQRA